MHPKFQPPVFVPGEYVPEMDRLSKAALMDIVWHLAACATDDGQSPGTDDIIAAIRATSAFVVTFREQQ